MYSGLEEIIWAKNSLHTALDLTWDILFPRLIWYSAINYFLLRYTSVIQSLCSVLIESLVFCYCWISPELTPVWHTFFLGYMMFSYKLFPTNIYFCYPKSVFSSNWNLWYFPAVTIVHVFAVSTLKNCWILLQLVALWIS